MFGSRNEGSAVVRGEENKRVLCDPQVLKKAQDFPHTVIDLPDSVPIPMGKMAKGIGVIKEQLNHNFRDGQQNRLAKFTEEEEESSSSQS